MKRLAIQALSVLALLGSITAACAAITSLSLTGKLTSGGAAGSIVNASCSVGPNGITGSGALYGVNPQTGVRYRYPFRILRGSTGPNVVYLYGKMDAGFPMRIVAKVPSGVLSFAYVLPNGTTVVSSGQGNVALN